VASYSFDTITQVRRKVGDRARPYEWADEDLDQFLTDASGNVNGAAALTLQAWAAKEARAWASVNAGGVSRSKQNPADALLKLAAQYARQSDGTVVLDDRQKPAFGVARIDFGEHLVTDKTLPEVADAAARRTRSEELED